ncbi:MAG: putative metal-binding motif-containing protein, partial [Deltaproteobacteria bacterium]|nr:putative metal-binding motif-containing protein [Deltaproteobacteria bacterium]
AGYGICRCTDGDGDGICAAADCDDGDPGVRPGHGERCWDRVDNDCDGEVDEGCPGPVEAQEPAGCGVGSGGGPWWWGVAAVVAWMRRRRPILRSGSP